MKKNPQISCAINTAGTNKKIPRPTDIVVKVYKNRIFIVATHYEKLGTLVAVTRGESLKDFDTATYDATTIFGGDGDDALAAAKYIAQSIEIDRPLLLSIALGSYKKDVLNLIIAAIKKLKTW